MTEKLLLDEIKANRSPSIQYTLFNKDIILKRYAFGLADIDNGIEVDDKTTYNAYSVTKTFTALAILQMAQREKLSLDDSIKKYLPDIPYDSEITIKQVLSHSAGIPNPIPLSWIHLGNAKMAFDRDQFFKGILTKYNKTKSRPNEKYAYSNLGYVLLGQILEKVSGMKYEEYIQKNIIEAIGIPETEMGFEIHDPRRHATGYHKRLSFSNVILGFLIDKSKYMGKAGSTWKPFNPFYVNGPSYGGLIGTPDSFMKYIQALLKPDCQLITNEYKRLLFTENYTSDNKPTGMCISWFKGQLNGNNYFSHAGGGGGYYCEIRIYPDLGLGSLIFFNRTGMSDQRFLDRIDKLYFENHERSDLSKVASC
ncbi:MAG: serine hydrolase domain-containing protein [Bacteroidales bacterium]